MSLIYQVAILVLNASWVGGTETPELFTLEAKEQQWIAKRL